jgi:pre-mRNA-splicing factor 38A
MANRSDPLINSVSGSDPQNCLEYITRQRIYDSRYWKEVCFGLTISDVLEKSIQQLQCVGTVPYMTFISLLLKLLQLNAEYDIIYNAFIDQDKFKYTTILGCVYIRLICRPIEIYTSLEPYYNDYRTIRVYDGGIVSGNITKPFTTTTIDQIIHQLLTSTHIFGITLPRLPLRRTLYDSNYLPTIRRPTALADVLSTISIPSNTGNDTENDNDTTGSKNQLYYNQLLERLRQKAFDEKLPSAIVAWEKRQQKQQQQQSLNGTSIIKNKLSRVDTSTSSSSSDIVTQQNQNEIHFNNDENDYKEQYEQSQSSDQQEQQSAPLTSTSTTLDHDPNIINGDDNILKTQIKHKDKKDSSTKKSKKDKRNYDNLFKKKDKNVTTNKKLYENQKQKHSKSNNNTDTSNEEEEEKQQQEQSDEYWNQERSKLGFKPLK